MSSPVLVVPLSGPLRRVVCPGCGVEILVAPATALPEVVDLTEGPIVEPHHLTPRQREVLGHVAAGESSKTIARLLGISVKTVSSHRTALMDVLELHSTAELVRYVIAREGA